MEVLGAIIATFAIHRAGESSTPWPPKARRARQPGRVAWISRVAIPQRPRRTAARRWSRSAIGGAVAGRRARAAAGQHARLRPRALLRRDAAADGAATPLPGSVVPEMTSSMIEISTGVCHSPAQVLAELSQIRDALVRCADKLNIAVVGGGTHPFQQWHERRIYDRPRFRELSELYGYLSKQFTIFGQHVHVGCPDAGQRAADAAPHVALHPALHRAVGLLALRAGPGHAVRFGAAQFGVRVPACRAARPSP